MVGVHAVVAGDPAEEVVLDVIVGVRHLGEIGVRRGALSTDLQHRRAGDTKPVAQVEDAGARIVLR